MFNSFLLLFSFFSIWKYRSYFFFPGAVYPALFLKGFNTNPLIFNSCLIKFNNGHFCLCFAESCNEVIEDVENVSFNFIILLSKFSYASILINLSRLIYSSSSDSSVLSTIPESFKKSKMTFSLFSITKNIVMSLN